jgi:hypothetical protein
LADLGPISSTIGKVGYPKKNYVVANYSAFNEAGEAWTVDANRASPEVWNAFVEKQTISFDEDRSIYPSNTDFGEKVARNLEADGQSQKR